mmetsp:Transcript_79534/g.257578  ORF Transcript_79534/g.257578 Transcript_79534/m.257578 type:complete len:338 (-) Transcript_79534:574-1587(-)
MATHSWAPALMAHLQARLPPPARLHASRPPRRRVSLLVPLCRQSPELPQFALVKARTPLLVCNLSQSPWHGRLRPGQRAGSRVVLAQPFQHPSAEAVRQCCRWSHPQVAPAEHPIAQPHEKPGRTPLQHSQLLLSSKWFLHLWQQPGLCLPSHPPTARQHDLWVSGPQWLVLLPLRCLWPEAARSCLPSHLPLRSLRPESAWWQALQTPCPQLRVHPPQRHPWPEAAWVLDLRGFALQLLNQVALQNLRPEMSCAKFLRVVLPHAQKHLTQQSLCPETARSVDPRPSCPQPRRHQERKSERPETPRWLDPLDGSPRPKEHLLTHQPPCPSVAWRPES